jgi:selenide,water dikinase
MAAASRVDVDLDVAAVPFLPGVRALAEAGSIPGGTRRNWDWVASSVEHGAVSDLDVLLLADAQTSGGLLFGAAPDQAAAAVARLGGAAAVIGRVRGGSGRITLD